MSSITLQEIVHQPDLWPTSLDRVRAQRSAASLDGTTAIVTGAGSSAYAAAAIAAAWPDALAIPTTEMLLDAESLVPRSFETNGLLVSVARSGDSPESLAVVELVQGRWPSARHLAITCNPEGRLANAPGVDAILLDPRTNDRSLAVTSSFSNTVVAGLALRHGRMLEATLPAISDRVRTGLPALDAAARNLAETRFPRVTVLAPPALLGGAREAALKILEMSDGEVVSMAETFLGVRHGPLTFLRSDGLVLCFGSTDPRHRRYEEDLYLELRAKNLGKVVVIAPLPMPASLVDVVIPANAPELPDALRTPFEIVFPQLVAFHLGVAAGLNPDEPSPRGVINRVVQGVRIHEA